MRARFPLAIYPYEDRDTPYRHFPLSGSIRIQPLRGCWIPFRCTSPNPCERVAAATNPPFACRWDFLPNRHILLRGEIYIPKKILLAEELPVLGTGKTDYITLTKMVIEEDQQGSGWIEKISKFVKKSGNEQGAIDSENVNEDGC